MQITPINSYNSNINPKNKPISFSAMKKAEFKGIDFAVVEKFKAPIEKFNLIQDFQNWAGNLVQKIKTTDYHGRQEETINMRKNILFDWFQYVIEENQAYTNAIKLIILSAITKNLGLDDDNLPPVLNKGVLADTVYELSNTLEQNKKTQFDFSKIYQNKLKNYYLNDLKSDETETKWIIIPSQYNDSENFEANVEKLKTLSHPNWCTKSFNAEPYLSKGDFHIYLENGEPKLGVRFIGDKIQEIQGELNNSNIPLAYLDTLQNHIKKENLKLNKNAKNEIKRTKAIQKNVKKAKKDIQKIIKEPLIYKIKSYLNSTKNQTKSEKIFNYFGLQAKQDKNGMLIISEYRQPNNNFSFKDVGIDENELFKDVINIEKSANFQDSSLTCLHNLESIGGAAFFSNSKIENLGNLKSINGSVFLHNSKLKHLDNLEYVGGNLYLNHSLITDLGKLNTINGDAWFEDSKVKSLGNLKYINGNAFFEKSNITDLGNLELIKGKANFRFSNVLSLGSLKEIGGDAIFQESSITSLGTLKRIGGNAYFYFSKVTDLGNLEYIGRNGYFDETMITDFKNLKTIGNDGFFDESQKNSKLPKVEGQTYFNTIYIQRP